VLLFIGRNHLAASVCPCALLPRNSLSHKVGGCTPPVQGIKVVIRPKVHLRLD